MQNTLKSIPVVRLFHLCEVEGYAKEFKRQFTEATDTMIEKIKERGILTNLQFSSIAKCQYLVDTFVKSTLSKDFKSKQRDKFENELSIKRLREAAANLARHPEVDVWVYAYDYVLPSLIGAVFDVDEEDAAVDLRLKMEEAQSEQT